MSTNVGVHKDLEIFVIFGRLEDGNKHINHQIIHASWIEAGLITKSGG